LPDDKKSSDIEMTSEVPTIPLEAESDEEGVWQTVGSKGRSATKLAQQETIKKTKPVQVEQAAQSMPVAAAAEEVSKPSDGAKQTTEVPVNTSELRSQSNDYDKSAKLMADLKSLEDILLNKLGCFLIEEGSDILSFKLEKRHSITFNRIYGRYFGVFFNASSNILQGNRTSFTKGVKDLFESKLSEGLPYEDIASKFLADIADLAKVLDRANNVKTIFRDSEIQIKKDTLKHLLWAIDKASAVYKSGGDDALFIFKEGALATSLLSQESHAVKAFLVCLDEFVAIKDMAGKNLDRYTELYNFGLSLALSPDVEIQQVGAMGGRA